MTEFCRRHRTNHWVCPQERLAGPASTPSKRQMTQQDIHEFVTHGNESPEGRDAVERTRQGLFSIRRENERFVRENQHFKLHFENSAND